MTQALALAWPTLPGHELETLGASGFLPPGTDGGASPLLLDTGNALSDSGRPGTFLLQSSELGVTVAGRTACGLAIVG